MSDKRCYLEINKENFRRNLVNLKEYLPKETKIIGIVKADYYGHGANELSQIMAQEGVSDFAVATLKEAIELREQGLAGSLLLLSYLEEENWQLASKYHLIIPVVSLKCAREMNEYCKKNETRLTVEVKVDTGMHRLGIDPNISEEEIKEIYASPYLRVKGTFSHLCCADSFEEEDQKTTFKQKEIFDEFLNRVKACDCQVGRTHLCASSGILNYPEFVYDYVRPGFMLLGFQVGETKQPIKRYPVLSWYSKIEMIKEVDENQGISYGHIYHTPGKRRIATISVGYGDGYPRRLSNDGYVVINGQKANIVGRICMDQMMVDVSDIDCKVEDEVTLIGEGISANKLAQKADTIVDELVCNINKRVSRYYI